MKKEDIFLILDNIRSAENVGAIFRTADAAGVSKIYLTGYSPTPIDRFNRPQPKVAKAALGAEKTISWAHESDSVDLVKRLRKEGVKVIAIEQSKDAIDYKDVEVHGPTALLFGSEVEGVSEGVQKLCDQVAEIPMQGEKESLNVSVSAGIALYRILDI